MLFKNLYTHVRNIYVVATSNIIRFTIPLYPMDGLGNLASVKIEKENIVLEFSKKLIRPPAP
jgi:hypothetical protein